MTGSRSEHDPEYEPTPRTRAQELLVFALLAVLIWPIASVGVVGGYGLGVWMYQGGPAHCGPYPKLANSSRNCGNEPLRGQLTYIALDSIHFKSSPDRA